MNRPRQELPRTWWLLVLAVALGLRLHVAPLEYGADESVYIQHAWNLGRGELDLADDSQYIHRLPVYLFATPAIELFGLNPWAVIVWPLLASLTQLLLAMLLALRLGGPVASVLAGILLAFLPLDVVSAVHLMPDGMMGSMMSGAVVLWWLGLTATTRRRRATLLLAAGAALGLAVLVRPYAGVLVLFFGLDLMLTRQPLRRLGVVAAGLLAVVLLYLVTYAIATGDPFYHVRVVAEVYSSGDLAEPIRLLFYPRLALHPTGPFSLYGIAFAASIALLLVRPRFAELRAILWVLIVAAFLEFGSMSLDSYVAILKRARFLTPLSLPLCVLLALALARIGGLAAPQGEPRRAPAPAALRLRRALMGVAVTGLVLGAVLQLERVSEGDRARVEAFTEVAARVVGRPELPVFVDHWRTAIRLGPHVSFFGGRGFYFDSDDDARMRDGDYDSGERLAYLRADLEAEELPEALILVDRLDPKAVNSGTLLALGLEPDGVPHPALRLVFAAAGLELYELSGRAAPVRTPAG